MGPWYDTAQSYQVQARQIAHADLQNRTRHAQRNRRAPNLPATFVTYALLALMVVSQAVVL